MMTQFSPRLLIAALGLISAISGGVLSGLSGNASASNNAAPRPIQAGMVPDAAAPVSNTPQPLAYAVLGEQQAFVWGYVYDQNLVPDLSWMQLQHGIQYRLFDEGHTCIGIVTAEGEPKLIHWFPDICSPAPAAPSAAGEGVARG